MIWDESNQTTPYNVRLLIAETDSLTVKLTQNRLLGVQKNPQLNGRKTFSSITDDTMMWRSFSRSIGMFATNESVLTKGTIPILKTNEKNRFCLIASKWFKFFLYRV